jgi:hypothetical protein
MCFYMSGDPLTLSRYVSTLAPSHLQKVVMDATLHCLYYQYVVLKGSSASTSSNSRSSGRGDMPEKEDTCLRVKIGSGMGFSFSGIVADIGFLCEKELEFPLDNNFRTRHGIRYYARYRDDVFAVVNIPMSGRLYEWRNIWHGGFFIVHEWHADMHSVDFLDITIFKTMNGLGYFPRWKISSLGVPLSTMSAHAPSIHLAWTKAEIHRLASHSSSYNLFVQAKRTFCNRLQKFHYSQSIIEQLRCYDPYLCLKSRIDGRDRQNKGSVTSRPKSRPLILILPFSRFWHKELTKSLRDFVADPDGLEALSIGWPRCPWLQHDKKAIIAWRNCTGHLLQVAQRISNSTRFVVGGVRGW